MLKIIRLLIILSTLSCSTVFKNNLTEDRFNFKKDFISVLQGPTSSTKTVINFLVPDKFDYEVNLFADNKNLNKKIYKTNVHKVKNNYWNVIELQIHELSLLTEYRLEIKQSKGSLVFEETRFFKTYDTKKDKHKFVIASCMADSLNEIGDIAWKSLDKLEADAYFLIGDLVYADVFNDRYLSLPIPNEQYLWSRYVDTRNKLALYRMKYLKPIYSIWDDHDVGQNNATKEYALKSAAQKIFRSFFPIIELENVQKGKGLGFSFSIPGNIFFFLDNRSFRDAETKKDGEHLGSQQTKWLLNNIKKTDSKIWLIEGDQFFGAYHQFESFEGVHPKKFHALIQDLKAINKDYRFISGDRHLYEFMKLEESLLGRVSYEVTTSGTHAKLFPNKGSSIPNKRRVNIIDDQYHSILLELDGPKAQFKVVNEQGKVLDHQSL